MQCCCETYDILLATWICGKWKRISDFAWPVYVICILQYVILKYRYSGLLQYSFGCLISSIDDLPVQVLVEDKKLHKDTVPGTRTSRRTHIYHWLKSLSATMMSSLFIYSLAHAKWSQSNAIRHRNTRGSRYLRQSVLVLYQERHTKKRHTYTNDIRCTWTYDIQCNTNYEYIITWFGRAPNPDSVCDTAVMHISELHA